MKNDERLQREEQFYENVAAIFEQTHHYKPFNLHSKKRWYNRSPGNGRYPGFGVVRYFGDNAIHIALQKPVSVNKICASQEEVLEFLNGVMGLQGPT